jgi:hypothetical protein
METLVLSVVFVIIITFCYSLWKIAVREEKKEISKLFN